MRIPVIIFLLLVFTHVLSAQSRLEGMVSDNSDDSPIAGAHVSCKGFLTTTDLNGRFELDSLLPGELELTISAMGYETQTVNVLLQKGVLQKVDVKLIFNYFLLDEVEVSATRNNSLISNVPGRINMITTERIGLTASQTVDELLSMLPGVIASRSFGPFSHKATVSMRGLGTKEQGRTLVLLNGIPVNKADGGSVNWNLISTGDIQRIEVIKGPGSALYGGNAMGGIINIVNKRPTEKIQGEAFVNYGTYNTFGGRASLGGLMKNGFYWSAHGFYRKSDGYITQSIPDQESNPFIVKSNFEEKALCLKAGYDAGEKFHADVDFTLYDDVRGTGEKVYQPLGNTTDHDTYQFRSTFNGKQGKLDWNASVFYIREKYKRVSEWYKDDYTWYDVLSLRTDYGVLTSVNYQLGRHGFTTGIDIRNGEVDASDIYYTSTDQVDNRGKMNFYGAYFQDEIGFFSDQITLIAGIRYDWARFYDGAFVINHPSAETNFMDQYQFSENKDVEWGAFSPRLSAQYKPNDQYRIYISYSRGFRPSVLDDLCRSGRVRGGFKVANPDLTPEYLDNIELGADYKPVAWLRGAVSTYYSKGTDFLYYVSTGDSIDMGYGTRPIMIPTNISEVEIFGFEAEITASPFPFLTLFGNYAFASSKIVKYTPLTNYDPKSLDGKYLADVPKHSFSIGGYSQSKIVDVGLNLRYVGKMYVNDQNIYDDIVLSDQYPAAFTIDLKLSRDLFEYAKATLSIQNILDKKIYESKGSVGPGRFVVLEVGVKF